MRKGEPWQREFTCPLGAVLYAASLVEERALVTLFNEFGVVIQKRIIIPNPVTVPGENRTRI